jgi:hypothetical protein
VSGWLVFLAFVIVVGWPSGSKRWQVHAAHAFAVTVVVGALLVLEKGWP